VAQFVVEDGQRSDAAVEGVVDGGAVVDADRRVQGLAAAAADGRRCAGGGVHRATVCRLVQLLLHHRHRDLAHFEEVSNRHLVRAASTARHTLGRRGRIIDHPACLTTR